jgi:hypothetical protein
VRPVAGVIGEVDIGADVFVEIPPLAVLIDEVGAVPLPAHGTVADAGRHIAGAQRTGGQEEGPGRLAVLGHLNDAGGQGMQAAQAAGQEILADDMGIQLDHGVVQVQHIAVVLLHGAIVHLIPADHAAKGMGPGHIIGVSPQLAPLFIGMRLGVQIRVPGLDILDLLRAKGPVQALFQGLTHV